MPILHIIPLSNQSWWGGGLDKSNPKANSPHNATEYSIMVEGLKRVTQNANSPHNATEQPLPVRGLNRVPKMPILHIIPLSNQSWWGGLDKSNPKAYSPHNATEHTLLVGGLNRATQNDHSPHNSTEQPIMVGGGLIRVTQKPILHIMPLSTPSWWRD